jgi:hypothetical protein
MFNTNQEVFKKGQVIPPQKNEKQQSKHSKSPNVVKKTSFILMKFQHYVTVKGFNLAN